MHEKGWKLRLFQDSSVNGLPSELPLLFIEVHLLNIVKYIATHVLANTSLSDYHIKVYYTHLLKFWIWCLMVMSPKQKFCSFIARKKKASLWALQFPWQLTLTFEKTSELKQNTQKIIIKFWMDSFYISSP